MWVIAWADNKTEYDVIEKKNSKKNWANKPQKKKIEILYFSWNVFFPQNFIQLPLAITLSAQVTYLPTLAMLPLLIP